MDLTFHYESSKYSFVNKDDIALANKIERGLKIAIASGSFDNFFYSVPVYKRGYGGRLKSSNITGKRFISELARDDGAINVTWTMNDSKREKELLPIKISLLRGMNSYRVFLIRKGDEEKISSCSLAERFKSIQEPVKNSV